MNIKEECLEKLYRTDGIINPVVNKGEPWFLRQGYLSLFKRIVGATEFMPSDTPMNVRVYCVMKDIVARPKCTKEGCDNFVKYSSNGFAQYCSNKCHMSSKERIEKNKKTCLEKYGVENYSHTEEFKKRQSDWSKENRELLSRSTQKMNFDRYSGSNRKLYEKLNIEPLFDGPTPLEDRKFKCLTCGHEFGYDPIFSNGMRCLKCHPRRESKLELSVVKWLEERGCSVVRNDRKLFGREIDIIVEDRKLGIELDGILWHSFGPSEYHYIDNVGSEHERVHVDKLDLLESQGWSLMRFTDLEVNHPIKSEIVKSLLSGKLGLNEKIHGRKCVAVVIDQKRVDNFLMENHLHGTLNASRSYGLEHNGELVMVCTFGRPRFSKDADWELYRLCTKVGVNVIGGFSKLIKTAVRDGVSGKIMSFVDRRISSGAGFERVGFVRTRVTKPGYFYWNKKSSAVVSRYEAQKHKLSKLLGESFDSNKTETENMYAAGYRKYYDCGNAVYEMTV